MNSKALVVLLGLVALGGAVPALARQAATAPAVAPAADPAFSALLKRAEAGEVSAYVDLAFAYLDEDGAHHEVKAAEHWLAKGVAAGIPEAMVELGNLYFDGEHVAQDRRKALGLYRRAAALGDLDGLYNVGIVYEGGGGIPENLAEALRWYRRAADAGSDIGMFQVAKAYHHGRGVRVDMGQAVFWLNKAVAAGSAAAMNDLGTLYSDGDGVPQDDAEALKLFIAAARNGSAIAMANVAVVHHNGEGVPVDYVEAIRWYQLAADNGYLPEQVIKGREIKPEIGGGMCQIGTTLFRMAMNSGMDVTQRRNHSLVVSYYADPVNGNPGTDATLYEPDLDLKFINDTGRHLLLQTDIDYKKQQLVFTLWGNPDGRSGSYTHPLVSRWIPAGDQEQILVDDGALKPGEKKCQTAFRGAVASFTYTRVTPQGEKIERGFDSYYRPLPKICLVGAEPGTCPSGGCLPTVATSTKQ